MSGGSLSEPASPTVAVIIETSLGAIEVALAQDKAPVTCGTFLHYVDGGFYSGGRFHRTFTPESQSNVDLTA